MDVNLQPVKVVISLGSNCGDRHQAVADAILWLERELENVKVSDIYETPAYGQPEGHYMNAVVCGTLSQDLTVDNLEQQCKRYELIHGRDQYARQNNLVPVDIDIVIVDGKILRPKDFDRCFFQIGYSQLKESM